MRYTKETELLRAAYCVGARVRQGIDIGQALDAEEAAGVHELTTEDWDHLRETLMAYEADGSVAVDK
jgi:hypothetical protein